LDIYGNDGAPAPSVDDFELKQAMARVMRFWEATTGQPASWEDSMFTLFDSEHQSGGMRSLVVNWGDRDSALNQVNTSHAHVSFEVSNLLATTPYTSQIKEMLVAVSISNNLDDQFLADIDLDLLANVKTLFVDCNVDKDTELVPWGSRAGIRQLEEWLRRRKSSGSPFDSVIFRACTVHLWSFFEHLRDTRAAPKVLWTGDGRYHD
jgi:hypothetical protein